MGFICWNLELDAICMPNIISIAGMAASPRTSVAFNIQSGISREYAPTKKPDIAA